MNFDLNIENYTRNELIEMFELPSNFDRNIIEIKETKLRDNIVNNNQLNKETKIQTINFLTKAKNIILNENTETETEKNVAQKHIEILKNLYNINYELKSSKLDDPSEHMIQIRENKPYALSYPSEFFPGIINPLKKRTVKKNLNIDTRFRDNYYSSPSTNFNLQLPLTMENILQMQLSSIELPTSYYVVSKQYNNNYFTITVNSSTAIVIIPDGNYNQTTIMEIINTQLSLLGAPFSSVSFIINLTNIETGSAQTMVGPNVDGVVTKLELNFQNDKLGNEDRYTPLPLKLGWNLGFRNGVYVGNLNYVSEGIVDITGPRYLYLVVDDFNNNVNNNFFSSFNSSVLNKNILARISIQAKNYNVLEQNNLGVVTTPREYFGPINLSSMNIQLLDEYGRIVDLNNMDYSFCLTLTSVYDL
jgi:hypothetical protein